MRKSITINGKLVTKSFKSVKDLEDWVFSVKSLDVLQDLKGEVWKPLDGYSRYLFSSKGRIKSLRYKNSVYERSLSFCVSKSGYLKTVLLNDEGCYKNISVHRMICLAFKGFDENKTEVNHKNGIKTDNSINNLEWCTRSENTLHAYRFNLQKPARGCLNGMSKLTKEQVDYARFLKKTRGRFWGRNELAKEYGISSKHLQFIVNNEDKTW